MNNGCFNFSISILEIFLGYFNNSEKSEKNILEKLFSKVFKLIIVAKKVLTHSAAFLINFIIVFFHSYGQNNTPLFVEWVQSSANMGYFKDILPTHSQTALYVLL